MKDRQEYTLGYIISADESKIGFRKIGNGESLILLHGSLMNSRYYEDIAKFLSQKFTVFIPDRRGRGLSKMADLKNYDINKEIEDLEAMVKHSNSKLIVGFSAGAVIALEASFKIQFQKMALYEPPALIDGRLPISTKWIDEFNVTISNRKYFKAIAIAVKGLQMSPLSKKNLWFIRGMSWLMMWGQIKKDAFEALQMTGREFEMGNSMNPDMDRYKNNQTDTLIISGTKSVSFENPLNKLAQCMPYAKRLILEGYDHGTPNFGDTKKLNEELQIFLLNRSI